MGFEERSGNVYPNYLQKRSLRGMEWTYQIQLHEEGRGRLATLRLGVAENYLRSHHVRNGNHSDDSRLSSTTKMPADLHFKSLPLSVRGT